ncbi:helix-turn-helix domain-containing protein [Umezawaea sp. Da 62-37]|uniref:AraC family transcriptional regulator n=1 Tax=Umezawaea sp. Da 62-37 TaxID=3075927 RepID=UPI0028F70F4B|nr:helix-turn-helix domain-containing protein [Umezawaea sp. Da 62-37]WNV82855.1 helix-turn-helix domain-containing protein [Umezawaea sp. Da 62-37]
MSHVEQQIGLPEAFRRWAARMSVATPVEGTARTVLAEPDHATTLSLREDAFVVIGPRTRARYHEPKRFRSCLTIRLRPGLAGALLGLPMRDLVDRVVPLRDLWRGGDLTDVAAVGRALAAREVPDDRLVRAAVDLLRSKPVHAAARELNVSERHLRAVFAESVGVSPKHFARLDRVRAVLGRAERGRLAHVAAETGYYDQSHMTAEFRDVMGVSPARFVAGDLPPPSGCSGFTS